MFTATIEYAGDYGTVAPMMEFITLNPAEMSYSDMGAEVIRFIQNYNCDLIISLTISCDYDVTVKFGKRKIPTLGSVSLGDLMCSMVNI